MAGKTKEKTKEDTSERKVRLPNAPLVEVVFELRWALAGDASVPLPIRIDPGYPILADLFPAVASKLGYKHEAIVASPPIAAYSIERRFYTREGAPFPLIQIGPGIFAANQSSEYTWTDFRKMVLDCGEALISSYPKLTQFKYHPVQTELRYINSFQAELVGTTDFIDFLARAMTLTVNPPQFMTDKTRFSQPLNGRIVLSGQPSALPRSSCVVDIGTGKAGETEIVRFENKLTSLHDDVPKYLNLGQFKNDLGIWLDASHDILSPLFRSLVKDEVMEKFG